MSHRPSVALLFGGRSGEHEVSLRSAASVASGLATGHDVLCVLIDKQGNWLLQEGPEPRPAGGEREDLVAAAVGEKRAVPAGEAVQSPEPRDELGAGAQQQVVGVREQDPGADLAQVPVKDGLHRRGGADRHEDRRLDLAVRRAQQTRAGAAVAGDELEGEAGHGRASIDSTA
jgi:D-alanine-D-alanine ligase-like ATP-grasp enzyme